jgi:hypothetical protein
MAQASGVRRPSRVALLLSLVAILGVLSAPLPWHGVALLAGPAGPGLTAGGPHGDATAPARAVGRPAAEPSLVCVHGPAEPFGTMPSPVPPSALARIVGHDTTVKPAPRAAHRATVGDRAPPARQSVL